MKEPKITTPFAGFLETWSHDSPDPFVERYAGLDDAEWEEKLVSAIERPHQDGIAFPASPPREMQERIHGHSGEHSIREAVAFYRVVTALSAKLNAPINSQTRLLDFGSGWGRVVRPFMARIGLKNLYGFEPNPLFCQVARVLNPYVTFFSGDHAPPTVFGESRFGLIIAWSVFTHLPAPLSKQWLTEFSRIMSRGGLLFFTAWGERFLDTLVKEKKNLQSGKPVHWFSKQVIESAGDLTALRSRYTAGEVVFVASSNNANYGDTFMSPKAARDLGVRGLELVAYDNKSLPQDLLVFKRA